MYVNYDLLDKKQSELTALANRPNQTAARSSFHKHALKQRKVERPKKER